MEQERLNLYYMDMKYIRDLHNADERVQSVSPQIHKSNRPFVGIVVICGKHKYIDLSPNPKDNPAQAHYKKLCIKEIEWCRKNQEAIVKKANKLYYLVQKTNCSSMLKKRCNDFKKLEKVLEKLLQKEKKA